MEIGTPLRSEIEVKRLISAFYYHFPENFTYGGEAHAGWEFVYAERGRIRVQAGNTAYILKSGEMVCHKPMEFHRLEPYQGSASSIIFCFECAGDCMQHFSDKILFINQMQKCYINDIATNASKLFVPKAPLDIVKDGCMNRSSGAEIRHEQFIKNSVELLVLSLLSSVNAEKGKRIESFEQRKQRSTLTGDIIAYLEENKGNNIRLSDVSARFSYSLSSIKRIFKEEAGVGILTYLNRLRLKNAEELLTGTDASIGEIAERIGFADIYYFSRAFKQKTGKTPTAFREESRIVGK